MTHGVVDEIANRTGEERGITQDASSSDPGGVNLRTSLQAEALRFGQDDLVEIDWFVTSRLTVLVMSRQEEKVVNEQSQPLPFVSHH